MEKKVNNYEYFPCNSSFKVSNIIKANRKKLHNISTAIKFKEEILHYVATDLPLEDATFTAHIFYNEKAELDQRHNLLSHLFDIENNFKIKTFESQKEYLDYRNEEIPEKYKEFFKYNRSLKVIERNDRKLKSYLLKAGYFIFLSNNHTLNEYSILQHYRKRDIVEKCLILGKVIWILSVYVVLVIIMRTEEFLLNLLHLLHIVILCII